MGNAVARPIRRIETDMEVADDAILEIGMGIAVARPIRRIETDMEVADDAWSSLLPDLLLDIFRRLESTAVIRCAGACKPWRRIIIGNARILRPFPDRYNPNLLLGFIHYSWYTTVTDGSIPPPPAIMSTAIDTGCCGDRHSSFITPASTGGNGLSMCYSTLASRDGFLLLRRLRSNHDGLGLCLYNPMAGDCTILPFAPIMGQYGEYVLLTGYDLSSCGTSRCDMGVRILAIAMPGAFKLCTEEGRLTYQVLCCGNDGAVVWGPVQRSEVNIALLTVTHGGNTVVSRDAVHWLGRTRSVLGCGIPCMVGLDIYSGGSWTTELPKQCQFYYSSPAPCALTLITSGDGRLSLLHPLPDHHITVWVLDGDASAMESTMQHKIWIDARIYQDVVVCPRSILESNYPNVVCPRSGLLFITLSNRLQLRIDLESGACQPVQSIRKRSQNRYYPYEMDWSTYISEMKNF